MQMPAMVSHSNLLEDFVDCEEISQIIGYKDGSLEISFKDNSNLQLSPCGANFKFIRPHDAALPFLAKSLNEVSQRCIFATSETKNKVVQALLIRNQLSESPYLVSEFMEALSLQPFRLYKEVEVFEWPLVSDTDKHMPSESITHAHDGTVTVTSKENFAQLELFPDKHKAQVLYAARLVEDATRIGTQGFEQTDAAEENKQANLMYVWQKRIFPVSQCPQDWRHPLELALGTRSETELKVSKAPNSLPKKCPKQFHHKWRQLEKHALAENMKTPDDGSPNISFLWLNGDFYWISSCNMSQPKIEVWLSDGSILQTHPTNDRYFIHKTRNRKSLNLLSEANTDSFCDEQFIERVLSSSSIPQELKLKSAFLCTIRLMTYSSQQYIAQGSVPCWKVEQDASIGARHSGSEIENFKLDLHENVYIPRVGAFSAVGDSVQITFDDGTMLHMFIKLRNHGNSTNFIAGQCRIVLKDGHYHVVDESTQTDSKVLKYVTHAYCWLDWLLKPISERACQAFYSGTIYDMEKVRMVSQELDRIQQATDSSDFGCKSSDGFKYLEPTGERLDQCVDSRDVFSALSRTSKAIEDLDEIISSVKKKRH